VDGGYQSYRATSRILCDEERPKPPAQTKCIESDCYTVLSREETVNLALSDPGVTSHLNDIIINLACEGAGWGVGEVATPLETYGFGLGCSSIGSVANGADPSASETLKSGAAQAACSVFGSRRPEIGAMCSLVTTMAPKLSAWQTINDAIDTSAGGGCYVIPINGSDEDSGFLKPQGFGIPSGHSWCYDE
jgi:hypothetical protein